jgi:hypothetical protein
MDYILHLKDGTTLKFHADTYEGALKMAQYYGLGAESLETVGATPTTPTATTTTAPVTTPTPSTAQTTPTIAQKYGVQEAAKWAGQPTPQASLLTPVEQATLTTTPPPPAAEYTQAQLDNYNDYLAFLKTKDGKNWPVPKDIADFLAHMDEWAGNAEYYSRGYTEEQLREFNTFKRYASAYGELTDWFPTNIEDWLANPDKAQKQLDIWKQKYGTALEEEAGAEKYALTPEEAARRREEGYTEERYAAKERYGETPMYPEAFANWRKEQSDMSGALLEYIQSEYPSLRAEFEAGLPRLTGYETREEARAEATKRESGFAAWLSEETPEIYQEYMGQRPAERGERYYVQAPTTRVTNW